MHLIDKLIKQNKDLAVAIKPMKKEPKYVEVQIFDPAENKGLFAHPDRYRYSIFRQNTDGALTQIGTLSCMYLADKSGQFKMELGRCTAQVIGSVDASQRMREDRIEQCQSNL